MQWMVLVDEMNFWLRMEVLSGKLYITRAGVLRVELQGLPAEH